MPPRQSINIPYSTVQQQSLKQLSGLATQLRCATPSRSHPVSCVIFLSCLFLLPLAIQQKNQNICQEAVLNLFWFLLVFVLTVYSSFPITCGELAKSRDERQPAVQLTVCASTEGQRGWLQEEVLLSRRPFLPQICSNEAFRDRTSHRCSHINLWVLYTISHGNGCACVLLRATHPALQAPYIPFSKHGCMFLTYAHPVSSIHFVASVNNFTSSICRAVGTENTQK